MNISRKGRKSFTLAEVLITLGIIGIVAALVVGNVVIKYKEKQTVIRVKKVYSILSNAYNLAQYENGEFFRKNIDWTKNTARREFLDKLLPFLDVFVDCAKVPSDSCFPKLNDRSGPFYFNKLEREGTNYFRNIKDSAVILHDGTIITVMSSPHSNLAAVMIMVDINGPAKPNHYGHDTFFFFIEDGTNNRLAGKRPLATDAECKHNSTVQAQACAYWILKYNNMDYP